LQQCLCWCAISCTCLAHWVVATPPSPCESHRCDAMTPIVHVIAHGACGCCCAWRLPILLRASV
jgi:hypothetical protein